MGAAAGEVVGWAGEAAAVVVVGAASAVVGNTGHLMELRSEGAVVPARRG